MASFSIELQLLLDAVHWRIHGASLKLQEPLKPAVEFDEAVLFKLAKRHNLLPWLLPYAKAFSIGSEGFIKDIVSYLLKAGIRQQLQTLELTRISTLLKEQHVDHAVLKGVSIEKQFYKGFVDSRYSDDIDLLVLPRDLRKVSDLLLANGYQVSEAYDVSKLSRFLDHHEAWFRWRDISFKKQTLGKESVDLHWRIADEFTIPVGTKMLLKELESVPVNHEDIPSLSFSTLFVFVCVHAYIDYFFRLRHLVDVYTAMQQPEFDLDEVTTIAKTWGVEDKVCASIATAEDFFSGALSNSRSAYSDLVRQRFIDANGAPVRSHPNSGEWSAKDKRRHLFTQVKFRSKKSWFFAPLVARCKYNHEMVAKWPEGRSAFFWYPFALVARLFP